MQPRQFKFQKWKRIRLSADFDRVFTRRCAAHQDRMGLYVDGNDLGFARLGVRISKRFGNAVKRVRARRCVREAFRRLQHELPPLDYIAVLRSTELTTDECESMLLELASRAHRKLNRKQMP
ncbi:MAG: ribonuclease P protein component [Planctomycetes bacterium]|nr:ribonuclease P protein component [Planctomycetota bacterium]